MPRSRPPYNREPNNGWDLSLSSGAEFSRNGSRYQLGVPLNVGEQDCIQLVMTTVAGAQFENFSVEIVPDPKLVIVNGTPTWNGSLRYREFVVFNMTVEAVAKGTASVIVHEAWKDRRWGSVELIYSIGD